jgi:hypothetical protein
VSNKINNLIWKRVKFGLIEAISLISIAPKATGKSTRLLPSPFGIVALNTDHDVEMTANCGSTRLFTIMAGSIDPDFHSLDATVLASDDGLRSRSDPGLRLPCQRDD